MFTKTEYYFSKRECDGLLTKKVIDYKRIIYSFLLVPIFIDTKVLKIKNY